MITHNTHGGRNMKLNNLQRNVLDKAVQLKSEELGVNIYTTNECYASMNHEPINYGVNWSAHGTVDADDAKEYAMNLLEAAEISIALNICEIEHDYSKEVIFPNRDTFMSFVSNVFGALSASSPTMIKNALDAITNA